MMKEDFNIENYKPQNIYTSPNTFYNGVQENVLRETLQKEEKPSTKVWYFKPYFQMAVAASIVLIFGLIWLLPTETNGLTEPISNKEISKENNNLTLSKNEVKIKTKETAVEPQFNKIETDVYSDVIKEKEEIASQNNGDEVIAEVSSPEPTEEISIEKPMAEENNISLDDKHNQSKIETMTIHQISDEELAEITMNMENDIYLELYN